MANPSGRSFRVIDTTHLAAVAVPEAKIGTGNELVERPEMAESGSSSRWIFSGTKDRYTSEAAIHILVAENSVSLPLHARKRPLSCWDDEGPLTTQSGHRAAMAKGLAILPDTQFRN